jgi:hypothetical protein
MIEIIIAIIIQIIGAKKIKEAILRITLPRIASNPQAIIAAPANHPISVCEEDEGIHHHQVSKFQVMAASTPAKIIGRVTKSALTVLATVFAIPNPPIIYLAIKKAKKLKNAAHKTP